MCCIEQGIGVTNTLYIKSVNVLQMPFTKFAVFHCYRNSLSGILILCKNDDRKRNAMLALDNKWDNTAWNLTIL